MKIEIGNKITDAQLKYIEALAMNLQYSRVTLYSEIQEITQRKILFLYELTKKEASDVITKFKKDWEEEKQMQEAFDESPGEYD